MAQLGQRQLLPLEALSVVVPLCDRTTSLLFPRRSSWKPGCHRTPIAFVRFRTGAMIPKFVGELRNLNHTGFNSLVARLSLKFADEFRGETPGGIVRRNHNQSLIVHFDTSSPQL
jgi:hypothetical protein